MSGKDGNVGQALGVGGGWGRLLELVIVWWSLRHKVIQSGWHFDISCVLLPEIRIE